MTQKSHESMLSFSELTRKTIVTIEENLLSLVVVITTPLLVAYVCVYTIIALFVQDFNTIETYRDLTQIFSFETSFLYYAAVLSLIIALFYICGLIAAKLILLKGKEITLKNILPKSLIFVGSYGLMLTILGLTITLVYIAGFILLFAVLTLVGIFNPNLIDVVTNPVSDAFYLIAVSVPSFFFTFAPFVLLDKDVSAIKAIKGSIKLVASHFWGVLLRIGIITILLLVTSLLVVNIPVVGAILAGLISTMIGTAFTYVLYQDITS